MSNPRTRRALKSGLALAALSMALGGATHNAKADGAEISLTPRVWYNFYSDSRFDHTYAIDSAGAASFTATAFELPFYGGTVTLRNPQVFGPGALAITVLNGEANARTAGAFTYYDPNLKPFVNAQGQDSVHRLDTEALFILPLRTSAQLLMGARYIGFDWNRKLHDVDTGKAIQWNQSSDAYYGEIGIGLAAPISENGRHVVFANLVGLFGLNNMSGNANINGNPNYSEWQGGVDANVGYAYQMTQDVKFSARYRLFERSQLNHWGAAGSELMHGPELGLTYTIGHTESLK